MNNMHKNYINLTPHTVVVMGGNTCCEGIVFPAPIKGGEARIDEMIMDEKTTLDNIYVAEVVYVPTAYGLPKPVENTMYIVSAMVRCALPHRTDLVSPYGVVRDAKGAIIGCKGFVCNRHAISFENL